MPNWVYNRLTVLGDPQKVEEFCADVICPSPRYALSQLEISLPQAFPKRETNPKPEVFSFHGIVPVPPEVLEQVYDPHGYNWQRENWGCKWDAGDQVKTGEATWEFHTAWNPPIAFCTEASKRRGLIILCSFYEEDSWVGRFGVSSGESFEEASETLEGEKYGEEEDEEAAWTLWKKRLKDAYYNKHEEFIAEARLLLTLE